MLACQFYLFAPGPIEEEQRTFFRPCRNQRHENGYSKKLESCVPHGESNLQDARIQRKGQFCDVRLFLAELSCQLESYLAFLYRGSGAYKEWPIMVLASIKYIQST